MATATKKPKASKRDLPPASTSIANQWKGGKLPALSYGEEQFRFWWKGPQGRVLLDGWCDSFSWDDQADAAPVITGSMSLRQSLEHAPIPGIDQNDQIVVEMRTTPAASWKQIVAMRVIEPQRLASGSYTFQLANDAQLLSLGRDSYRFSKDKSHPHGWKPWQIVDAVCARSQIRVVCPKVGKPIKKFWPMLNSSPLDVINAALKHLRDTERKSLVRNFAAGTLYISERHYSPELLTLGPQIIEASLVDSKLAGWATAMTVRTVAERNRSRSGRGTKRATHKGIVVNISSPAMIKRYGYVHLTVYAHGATSAAEVRRMGLAHLARVLVPKRTITITTPFIPGLRRGAYIRLGIPSLGLTQIVYVQSVSYSASPGTLTMDVTCGFEDPQITPPVDLVNQSSRYLYGKGKGKGKKKKNSPQTGTKMDAATAKPPPPHNSYGGVSLLNPGDVRKKKP